MSDRYIFEYRFWPAGQGIFASGTVSPWVNHTSGPSFSWVFDCGSTAPSTVLRPVVKQYRKERTNDRLDLLCISHFHKDHVSGLGDLLNGLHVDTVVMPYWSSAERLMAAATDDDADPDFADLLANPVAFVLERAESVETIVLVGGPDEQPFDIPPVNDRPPAPQQRKKHPKPDNVQKEQMYPEDRPWKWRIYWERDGQSAQATPDLTSRWLSPETIELAKRLDTKLRTHLSHLELRASPPSGGNEHWEFLFHHKPIAPGGARAIGRGIRKILNEANRKGLSIADVLKNVETRETIRTVYESFVSGGESLNSTSLCVYAGPVSDSLIYSRLDPLVMKIVKRKLEYHWRSTPGESYRSSILYTGDANFALPANRRELRILIDDERWGKIGVLQVPHHGSRYNWESGSSNEFSHNYSVFCADETNQSYEHPNREVMLDLLAKGPVLVNKKEGIVFSGYAWFR